MATGLGLVLTQNPIVFNSLRYLGAAYLMYLAYKIMRYGISTAHAPENPQAQEYKSIWSSYRQGMLTSLANPKALLFLWPYFHNSHGQIILSTTLCILGL